MKYLLDTHTLIWWALEPNKLSKNVLILLEDPDNEIFFSVVSIWEMQIKIQLNKLRLPLRLSELIEQQQTINHIDLLPLLPSHIYAMEKLPFYHKDPFDRLLIAQSFITNLIFISKDPAFVQYPIHCVW